MAGPEFGPEFGSCAARAPQSSCLRAPFEHEQSFRLPETGSPAPVLSAPLNSVLLPLLLPTSRPPRCSYVQSFRYQCAVGLSGVIFGLVVIDNNVSGASTRRCEAVLAFLSPFFGVFSAFCWASSLYPHVPTAYTLSPPPWPCSIFGFFSVPAKAYPWVLLVVWQLLVPQASFLGHLSGVVVSKG